VRPGRRPAMSLAFAVTTNRRLKRDLRIRGLVHLSRTSSRSSSTPSRRAVKLRLRYSCQPGFGFFAHSGSVGVLFRSSTEDGVR
jgi:hypothetical protein